jgi:hypothetical protein
MHTNSSWGNFKILLDAISFSVKPIINLLLFLVLKIYNDLI